MEPPSPDPRHSQGRSPIITRFGGALGISGTCVGFAVFLAACAGFDAAFRFAYVPLALGAAGLLISIIGGMIEMNRMVEDTHVLAAIFASAISLVGGFFELAVLLNWHVLGR